MKRPVKPDALLSLSAIADRLGRRPEWVKTNVPSISDPEGSGRRLYSWVTVEAWLKRRGEIEAEKANAA